MPSVLPIGIALQTNTVLDIIAEVLMKTITTGHLGRLGLVLSQPHLRQIPLGPLPSLLDPLLLDQLHVPLDPLLLPGHALGPGLKVF